MIHRDLKIGLGDILGKRIVAVVAKERAPRLPAAQVMLVFDDGTWFELYGPELDGSSGLNTGGHEAARRYMGAESIVFEQSLTPPK